MNGFSVGIVSDRVNFRTEKILELRKYFGTAIYLVDQVYFSLSECLAKPCITSQIPDYAAALTSSMGLSWLLAHISLLGTQAGSCLSKQWQKRIDLALVSAENIFLSIL